MTMTVGCGKRASACLSRSWHTNTRDKLGFDNEHEAKQKLEHMSETNEMSHVRMAADVSVLL